MKRMLLMAAAGIVIVANGWGVLASWRNRGEARGGRLELTEHELRLETGVAESTATLLHLEWRAARDENREEGFIQWLDAAKLAELGFDCRMPLENPSARHHYEAMPAKPVFLALEYAGEAWKNAGASARSKSRLFVVDAGQNADQLRNRHPDRQRILICRGAVQLAFVDHDFRSGATLTPRIKGRIRMLDVDSVFVPRPHNRALLQLQQTDSVKTAARQSKEPRYAVTICSGANYEPWVEEVRLLRATDSNPESPSNLK